MKGIGKNRPEGIAFVPLGMNTFLPENFSDELNPLPEQEVKALIRDRVLVLLRDDFSFLVNSLYRLDIPERTFQAALELSSTQEIAESLANAIYAREIEKAESRRKHRNCNEGKED